MRTVRLGDAAGPHPAIGDLRPINFNDGFAPQAGWRPPSAACRCGAALMPCSSGFQRPPQDRLDCIGPETGQRRPNLTLKRKDNIHGLQQLRSQGLKRLENNHHATLAIAASMMAGGIYSWGQALPQGFYAMAAIDRAYLDHHHQEAVTRKGKPLHQPAGRRQDRKAADGCQPR